jgi:hypothetical protein
LARRSALTFMAVWRVDPSACSRATSLCSSWTCRTRSASRAPPKPPTAGGGGEESTEATSSGRSRSMPTAPPLSTELPDVTEPLGGRVPIPPRTALFLRPLRCSVVTVNITAPACLLPRWIATVFWVRPGRSSATGTYAVPRTRVEYGLASSNIISSKSLCRSTLMKTTSPSQCGLRVSATMLVKCRLCPIVKMARTPLGTSPISSARIPSTVSVAIICKTGLRGGIKKMILREAL